MLHEKRVKELSRQAFARAHKNATVVDLEEQLPESAGANLVIDEADRKVREVIEKYDGDPKFTGSTGGHYVSIKMSF